MPLMTLPVNLPVPSKFCEIPFDHQLIFRIILGLNCNLPIQYKNPGSSLARFYHKARAQISDFSFRSFNYKTDPLWRYYQLDLSLEKIDSL